MGNSCGGGHAGVHSIFSIFSVFSVFSVQRFQRFQRFQQLSAVVSSCQQLSAVVSRFRVGDSAVSAFFWRGCQRLSTASPKRKHVIYAGAIVFKKIMRTRARMRDYRTFLYCLACG
jgi:hypothetical protein